MNGITRVIIAFICAGCLFGGLGFFYVSKFVAEVESSIPDIMARAGGGVMTYGQMDYSLSLDGLNVQLKDASLLYHNPVTGNKVQFKMPVIALGVPYLNSGKVSVGLPSEFTMLSKFGDALTSYVVMVDSPEYSIYMSDGALDEMVLSFDKFAIKGADGKSVKGGYGYLNYNAFQGSNSFAVSSLDWGNGVVVDEFALRHALFPAVGLSLVDYFAEALHLPLEQGSIPQHIVRLAAALEVAGLVPISEMRLMLDQSFWFSLKGGLSLEDGYLNDADLVLTTNNGRAVVEALQKLFGQTPLGLARIIRNTHGAGHFTSMNVTVREHRLTVDHVPIEELPKVKSWFR